MNITKNTIVFIVTLSIFLLPDKGYTQGHRSLYSQAVKYARSGDTDSAFMYFRRFLRAYPKSRFSERALFAIGEYYFQIADYYDAARIFMRFINNYPQSKARPFALAYLLTLANITGKEELTKDLEKEIISSQQITFLFREFKEYEYSSPLSKRHKAVYFIDKVEFYIDEELFTQVLY